jgi:hypothetical protein
MKIHTILGYQFDSNIYIIDREIPTIIDTGNGLHQNLVEKEWNFHIQMSNKNLSYI